MEPLFVALNVLSSNLGLYIYGVNVACTSIFLVGVFAYARTTARPWVAVAVVTPYLCFVIGMSSIRQAAAIGVVYLALAHWSRLSTIIKVALIIIAAGFHYSAIVTLILVVLDGRGRAYIRIGVVAILIGFLLIYAQTSDVVETYQNRYITKENISYGAAEHVLLSAIPAMIYFGLRKKLAIAGWDNRLVAIGSAASIIGLPLLLVSTTAVDRLVLFFSYVQMWVYPALIATFKSEETRLLIGTTLLALSIFVIYFTFGRTLMGYIPYHSLLFEI